MAELGAARWDPQQYLRFGDDRARPFFDLMARVGAEAPARVVDLGCGPGTLTVDLAERWPSAQVVGVDNSPDMIDAARALARPGLSFALGDVRSWQPDGPVDVIVTNATLHWVPGHDELLASVAGWLAEGGWLAMQVPGNFDAPSHRRIVEVCAEPRWAARLRDAHQRATVLQPAGYASILLESGLSADVWETTYLHVLQGEDPVLEWVRGTALRPILTRLGDDDANAFCAELAPRLRDAYPPGPFGTLFPFRRLFAVGHRS